MNSMSKTINYYYYYNLIRVMRRHDMTKKMTKTNTKTKTMTKTNSFREHR